MSVAKRQTQAKKATSKRRKNSTWYIKTIHVLKSKAGLDDDTYRTIMNRLYQRESSKELSYNEAMDFIDRLKSIAENTPAPPLTDRGVWISAPQRRKIIALCMELGWKTSEGEVDKRRLHGFIERQIDLNKSLDMLLLREASKVITGLERLHNLAIRKAQKGQAT